MACGNPLISVLIASYNYESYIADTIRSIWAQPYDALELIVVDDCSTDNSVNLLKSLQQQSPVPMIVQTNERNLGPALTCNRALECASGQLVAFLGSDDLFMEDRFTSQVDFFRRHKDLQIIYGNGFRFTNEQRRGLVHGSKVADLLSSNINQVLKYLYTNSNPLFIQTALMKRELLQAIGGFDGSALADDWVLNTKIFEYLQTSGGEYRYLDEPLFLYRIHGDNLHGNFKRHAKLKLDFIERCTPEPLRNKARANIVYGLALQALQVGDTNTALDFFLQSNSRELTLGKKIRFCRKFLGAAFFSSLARFKRAICIFFRPCGKEEKA